MSNNTYSQRVRITGYLMLAILSLSAIELASFAVIRTGLGILSKYLLVMPTKRADEFHDYLERRDNLLGWPSSTWKDENTNRVDGSRISPANKGLKNREICVSLYGDSFTFADEVEHDLAWGNLLANKLGCQVKNYGVSGFGTGQAVMRYEHDTKNMAHTVILGLFPDDLNRIQNQWRHLLTGNNPFGFKPSFSIDDNGSLQLHKIPVKNYDDYARTIDSPSSILKNEFYLPDRELFRSRVKTEFPYTITLVKLGFKLLKSIDYSKLPRIESLRYMNYPTWYDSENGPDNKKIRIFVELVKRFAEISEQRQQKSILLLIPDPEMVRDVQLGNKHTLDSEIARISDFLKVIDATQFLADKMLDKGVCYYYGISRDCSGHLNREGNELLATYVYSELNKEQ